LIIYLRAVLNYVEDITPKLRMVMNSAVGRMWKEAAVAFINIVSHDSLAVIKENRKCQSG
jgi:hypothetical protein